MKNRKDNAFDLAIVDPQYGNKNITGGYTAGKGGGIAEQKKYHKGLWKQKKPDKKYFQELKRVSKNQIIWGANHLVKYLEMSSGWIFWDKRNGDVSFSDGELAYTSFNIGLRKFSFRWSGMLQQNMKHKEKRIHPTQKPVALYKWLLKNYAKPGDKLFDSHSGSGSFRIAAWDLGFDLVSCEIDSDYYRDNEARFQNHIKQSELFDKSEYQDIIYDR